MVTAQPQPMDRREAIRLALSVSGYTDTDDLGWLYDQAAVTPAHLEVVEIGAYLGRSTTALAAGRAITTRKPIWTIDHFLGSPEHIAAGLAGDLYRQFCENISRVGIHVSVVPYSSVHAALVGHIHDIGFLFLDGAHDYESVRDDLVAWIPLLANGGILAVHDYVSEKWMGVKRAVDEIAHLEAVASIWAGRLS
jgi:hypothetical protein